MAITATLLDTGDDETTDVTKTTASVSPGANRLILLAMAHAGGAVQSVSGNGLTWVEVANVNQTDTATLYRAMGSSPTSGAISIEMEWGEAKFNWSVVEFDGVDTGGSNGADAVVQSVTAQSNWISTLVATLAAFADANNRPFGLFQFQRIGSDPTVGSGFTKLHIQAVTLPGLLTEWVLDGTDTSVDATQDSAGYASAVAIEIKAAAAAAEGAATLVGAGVVSAAGEAVTEGAATLVGVGVVSAAATATRIAAGGLVGVGLVSAAGQSATNGAAGLVGVGLVSAAATATRIAATVLVGVGNVSAAATVTRIGGATLVGVGVVSAAADSGLVLWPPPAVTDDGPRGDLAAALVAALDAVVAVLPAPVSIITAPAVVVRPSDPYQAPIVAAGAPAAAWAFEVDLIVDRRFSAEGLALLDGLRIDVCNALPSGWSWLTFGTIGELQVGRQVYLRGVLEVAAVILEDSRV